jgi:predicted DNA-binding protein
MMRSRSWVPEGLTSVLLPIIVQEVSQKQAQIASKLVSLSVRVSPETAERLKLSADAHYRPVATHLRWLIDEHLRKDADLDMPADPDSKAAA